MPLFKRKDVPRLIQAIKKDEVHPVYLLFGDRFLCRDVADSIIRTILPEEKQRASNITEIDGDRENPAHTMNLLKSYSLFAGRRIFRVMDSRLFFSKNVAKSFWGKAVKAWEAKDHELACRYLGQMYGLAGLTADDGIMNLPASRWKKLFGFSKPRDVGWLKEIAVPETDEENRQSSGADLVEEVMKNGIAPQNVLILVAEAIDKRKKLYKFIKETAVVIDLAVDSGATAAARKDQNSVIRDLIYRTLNDFHKKIESRALQLLLERIGFHPVAAVNETEKLALYSGERESITAADVDAIVGRTRDEALFEFTEAFAGANLAGALLSLHRLRENGIHSLMIVAGLRNFIRKLLLARAFQEQPHPVYARGLSYGAFQKGYLSQLKEAKEEWPALLGGHPYVVYKTFLQAEKFHLEKLKRGLAQLLAAEQSLKSSSVEDTLILENFLFDFLLERNKTVAI